MSNVANIVLETERRTLKLGKKLHKTNFTCLARDQTRKWHLKLTLVRLQTSIGIKYEDLCINDHVRSSINECTKVQNPWRCACTKCKLHLAYVHVRNRLTSKPSGSVHLHCWKRYSFDWSSTHAYTPSCCNLWCFAVHRTGKTDCG